MDHDNEVCRGCPLMPFIKDFDDLCVPCRKVVQLHLDLTDAITAAQKLVEVTD